MKKYFIITIILVLTTKILFSQTNVSGGIYTNTTWLLSGSPYNVVGNVTVFPSVTLTIEPGVIVRFSDAKLLDIQGHINATGNSSDSITFTSASSIPIKGIWPGINLGGLNPGTALFDYVIFEYANSAVDLQGGWGGNGPISISHSRFSENNKGTYGYGNFTLPIDSCTFTNNGSAIGSSYTSVSNSTFINNTYGAFQIVNLSVYNSTFCGHDIALKIGGGPIKNCLIHDNEIGIEPYFNLNGIDSNVIVKNNIGLKVFNDLGGNGNIICQNNNYNILNINTNPIDASDNCWCTTDSLAISQKIYDGYDNISLGLISFSPNMICNNSAIPILTNCNSVATGTDIKIECDSLVWIDGNTYYTSNNTATHTIIGGASNLDDSLIYLDLVINNLDLSVTQVGVLLTADESGASYQWLDCPMSPINGATNQSYPATTNGDYAVIISKNGCSDTSSCYSVNGVGIIENNFGDELLLYPNPTDGNFSIDLGRKYQAITITISDLSGKIIQSKIYNEDQLLSLELKEPTGIYLLIIESKNKKAVIRLTKE